MSAITLWVYQNNFYLVNKEDFQNATLFRPIIDRELDNQELSFQDKLMDLLSKENIFSINDCKLVSNAIDSFIENRLKKNKAMKSEVIDLFKSMKDSIAKLENDKNSKYFVINADSRREHVRNWVEKWDDNVLTPNGLGRYNKGGYILLDITKLENRVTDFVKIEGDEIKLIPNNKFVN